MTTADYVNQPYEQVRDALSHDAFKIAVKKVEEKEREAMSDPITRLHLDRVGERQKVGGQAAFCHGSDVDG